MINVLKSKILLYLFELSVCLIYIVNNIFNASNKIFLNLDIISQWDRSMFVTEKKFIAETCVKATKMQSKIQIEGPFRLHMVQFFELIDYKIPSFLKSLQIKS
ncbi:hypothetical protein ACFW04_011537 [Cataglyphis niger]